MSIIAYAKQLALFYVYNLTSNPKETNNYNDHWLRIK